MKLVKYIFIWAVINAILFVILMNIDDPLMYFQREKNLKDGYAVLKGNRPIVYRSSSGYYGDVLPFGVREAAADKRWIVAATEGLDACYRGDSVISSNGKQYWIIDKKATTSYSNSNTISTSRGMYPVASSGLYGPYDSISFTRELKKYNIKLKLD